MYRYSDILTPLIILGENSVARKKLRKTILPEVNIGNLDRLVTKEVKTSKII